MGCFNTIIVPCPECGEPSEFQTKGGDCTLRTFDLKDAPPNDLSDVNRHAPNQCEKCKTWFEVKYTIAVLNTKVVKVSAPEPHRD